MHASTELYDSVTLWESLHTRVTKSHLDMGKETEGLTLLEVLQSCELGELHASFTSRGVHTVDDVRDASLTWLSAAQAAKVTPAASTHTQQLTA